MINNINITLLLKNQEKLISSFKNLFRKYKIDNTISKKYTKREIHTNITFNLNTDNYIQLDEFIHLILEQNIYDIKIDNEIIEPFIYFTSLYLSLLSDNNYIIYKITNTTSNTKTEYMLKKVDNKYIIQEDYYNLYRDESLYNDSSEYKEISKEEAKEIIFYNIGNVSIHNK